MDSVQKSSSSSAELSGSTMTMTEEVPESAILEENILALKSTIKPFIFKLDESIASTSASQQALHKELDELLGVLERIRKAERFDGLDEETRTKYKLSGDIAADIELKSRQLLGLKRRLTLVHSILQTVNSRVKKLMLTHNSRVGRAP